MKPFWERGIYRTRGSLKAIVAGLRQFGTEWVIVGAVEDPSTKALMLTAWTLKGAIIFDQPMPKLDLLEKSAP